MPKIIPALFLLVVCLISRAAFGEEVAQPSAPTVTSGESATPVTTPEASVPSPQGPSADEADSWTKKWKFAIGAGLSISSFVRYDEMSYVQVFFPDTRMTTADYRLTNPVSIFLEARHMAKDSWGFVGGYTHDQPQEITDGNVSGINPGDLEFSGHGEIQFDSVYANVVHQWQEFYAGFGVNSSIVQFKATRANRSTSEGGIGTQIVLGTLLEEGRYAVELVSRDLAVSAKMDGDMAAIDSGAGKARSLILVGKYLF